MAQIKLNTIQIVHMPHYEKLLIQIVNMAHICENDMIQIKDMFQIVATWLQFSTEEYLGENNFRTKKGKLLSSYYMNRNPRLYYSSAWAAW